MQSSMNNEYNMKDKFYLSYCIHHSWRIAPVLTSTAPIAYVAHSWISMFLLSPSPSSSSSSSFSYQNLHHHHNNMSLIPIILISILLLSPFLFLLLSSTSSTSFPVCIYKTLERVNEAKEIELEEKKNTLLDQLFMKKKRHSKLTLQQ